MNRLTLKSGEEIELNQAFNCDCLEFMNQLPDKCIDVVLTDIPYGEVNEVRGADKQYGDGRSLRENHKGEADIVTFKLSSLIKEINRITKGTVIIFCGIGQVSEIYKQFKTYKKVSTRLLIWEKLNPSPMNGDKMYLSGIETAIYARKPKAYFGAFCKNTVFRHPNGFKEIHPTQKPIKLFKKLLKDNTKKNMLVFDPFMGSFTTAIACKDLSLDWLGCELSQEFFKSGYDRYTKETKQLLMDF
ncbi:MAG: site-specific DNA-methyltransferase [Proteobacteria bacterium]|nr:site-specific DNA-methyltransferase [Pseudomonadota bacterium]